MDEAARTVKIRQATEGDADALQVLIVEYHRALRRSVVRGIDPAFQTRIEPEDILQQTYVSAFNSILRCEFDGPGAFFRWLESIAVSRIRDQERALRRQKRDVSREMRDGPDLSTSYPQLVDRLAGSELTPSRRLARDEAVAAVMACLARLSAEQRKVVQLRFLEDQPVEVIAERLGKTEGAIHMLCHRGLQALRQRLQALTQQLTRSGI